MSAVLSRTPSGADAFRVGSLAWCICPSCDARVVTDIGTYAQTLLLENMFDGMLTNHRCDDSLVEWKVVA